MENKKVIIGGVVITSLVVSTGCYSTHKIHNLQKQNKMLQNQVLDLNNEKESRYKTLDTTYKDILEINRKNVNLIVYEAQSQGYSKTITDDKWIELQMTLETKYDYQVTIDLRNTDIYQANDKFVVSVDLSSIELSSINIEPADISYDLNMFNRWKGVTISSMTSSIVTKASQDIENSVLKDYNSKKALIQSRAKDKILQIYKGLPVDVVFVGGE